MENYFELAYKEAQKAYKKNEIPVGTIIVKNNKVISKGHNNRQRKCSVLGHAEINAILLAEKKLKDWRLDGCDMYVTLRPCQMCENIIRECRLDHVYYILDKPQTESHKSISELQTSVCKELCDKYANLVNNFFQKLRK